MIKNIITLLSLCLILPVGLARATDQQLIISPGKCVTLKQGNRCYQDIEASWQTLEAGDYCLKLATQEEPLQCWSNLKSAKYEFEFVGKQSTMLGLVDAHNGKLLTQTDIEVKWVYRNRSRNLNWRVF